MTVMLPNTSTGYHGYRDGMKGDRRALAGQHMVEMLKNTLRCSHPLQPCVGLTQVATPHTDTSSSEIHLRVLFKIKCTAARKKKSGGGGGKKADGCCLVCICLLIYKGEMWWGTLASETDEIDE